MNTPTKKPRVAIFVESHEGYGHFNIVSQLTKQLENQGVEVMILSGTLNYAGAAQNFNMRDARIVHLPLVDYRIQKLGKWEYTTPAKKTYSEAPEYIAQRKQVIRNALEDFKPDMIISELYPFQQPFRDHDIKAIDETYDGANHKPLKVCLCRDIIHSSNPQHVIAMLNKHFDRIVVRGDNRFAKLADSQSDWKNIAIPVEYMGNYITPMPNKNLKIDERDRPIVIFGGGGYYDKDLPLFESLITSRQYSKKFGGRKWDIYLSENAEKHMLADPQNPSKQISALAYITRLASSEGHGMIRVFPPIESKKFREEIANASLVITRGGYNTTFELFAAGQPQLVIPRDQKEQIQRANVLYKHGIAQVFPEYPIPETNAYNVITKALGKPEALAHAIDHVSCNKASVPELDNHGARTTAKRLVKIITKAGAAKRLHLLIAFKDEKYERRDAEAIAAQLEKLGHTVRLVDVKESKIINDENRKYLKCGEQKEKLSAFDGLMLRASVRVKEGKAIADSFRAAHIPIFQDVPMMEAGGDKLESQTLFEKNHIPTPKTFGLSADDILRTAQLNAFLEALGEPPYVVKSTHGWCGKNVRIAQTKDEAIQRFLIFHEKSRLKRSGGALLQEYIESDPASRHDYRVQTVVGVDEEGKLEAKVVAVGKQIAAPGKYITNTHDARLERISIDEEEAHTFFVGKKKMSEEEFQKKLTSGEIELLSPKVRDAALKTALVFGPGSLGIDIIVGAKDNEPKVLEVNPFATMLHNFERWHGFSVYAPWAEAFADYVSQQKLQLMEGKAKPWEQKLKNSTSNNVSLG